MPKLGNGFKWKRRIKRLEKGSLKLQQQQQNVLDHEFHPKHKTNADADVKYKIMPSGCMVCYGPFRVSEKMLIPEMPFCQSCKDRYFMLHSLISNSTTKTGKNTTLVCPKYKKGGSCTVNSRRVANRNWCGACHIKKFRNVLKKFSGMNVGHVNQSNNQTAPSMDTVNEILPSPVGQQEAIFAPVQSASDEGPEKIPVVLVRRLTDRDLASYGIDIPKTDDVWDNCSFEVECQPVTAISSSPQQVQYQKPLDTLTELNRFLEYKTSHMSNKDTMPWLNIFVFSCGHACDLCNSSKAKEWLKEAGYHTACPSENLDDYPLQHHHSPPPLSHPQSQSFNDSNSNEPLQHPSNLLRSDGMSCDGVSSNTSISTTNHPVHLVDECHDQPNSDTSDTSARRDHCYSTLDTNAKSNDNDPRLVKSLTQLLENPSTQPSKIVELLKSLGAAPQTTSPSQPLSTTSGPSVIRCRIPVKNFELIRNIFEEPWANNIDPNKMSLNIHHSHPHYSPTPLSHPQNQSFNDSNSNEPIQHPSNFLNSDGVSCDGVSSNISISTTNHPLQIVDECHNQPISDTSARRDHCYSTLDMNAKSNDNDSRLVKSLTQLLENPSTQPSQIVELLKLLGAAPQTCSASQSIKSTSGRSVIQCRIPVKNFELIRNIFETELWADNTDPIKMSLNIGS